MRHPLPGSVIVAFLVIASLAQAQSENPRGPMMPEIQALWSAHEAAQKTVAADRDKKLANLDYLYLLDVEKLKNDRAAAGDLDGALAAKAELERLRAHQALTDEQRKATNPALQALRASYDAALKGYHDEAAKQNAALLQKLLADLEALQTRITTTGDLDKALRVNAEKERIAGEGAKAQPPPITPEVKVAPVVGSTMTKFGAGRIADATKERAFVNSLGMEFVPVPGTQVLFCRWETRVKDYAAYAQGKTVDDSWTKQQKDGVPLGREPEHPVCGVSWDDANAFCEWLTKTESDGGKLPKGSKYRLPTDEEWSRAVGLATEAGATPKERHRKNTVDFPWGTDFPPKAKVGNYADSAFHEKFAREVEWIEGYTDGHGTAAPVGSFAPNRYGIYDLGGNVWEWCEDLWEPGGTGRLFRGASWNSSDRLGLLSSHRVQAGGNVHVYRGSVGFRCVVGASAR